MQLLCIDGETPAVIVGIPGSQHAETHHLFGGAALKLRPFIKGGETTVLAHVTACRNAEAALTRRTLRMALQAIPAAGAGCFPALPLVEHFFVYNLVGLT